MKNALVLMTALLPTTGHADLIKFAANLPEAHVWVLINDRTFEPTTGAQRAAALREHFASYSNITIRTSTVDNAPQNPGDMPVGFWEWWRDEANRNFPETGNNWDYVVASEPYGANVAETLNADFVPYDIQRTFNPTRGTNVRRNLWDNWDSIIVEARRPLMLRAVMFGQESVGKTTLSRTISETLNAARIPEYARPYLECQQIGVDVTERKMGVIHAGQAALQQQAYADAVKPVLLLDTDLFSTVGYYSIFNHIPPVSCVADALRLAGDVYYLLPDSIPFCPDPLRYGGEKRESTQQFWVELLQRYRLQFVVVPDGDVGFKTRWVADDVLRRFKEKNEAITRFERE